MSNLGRAYVHGLGTKSEFKAGNEAVFANNIFAHSNKSAKFAKVFTREKTPLYGMCSRLLYRSGTVSVSGNEIPCAWWIAMQCGYEDVQKYAYFFVLEGQP